MVMDFAKTVRINNFIEMLHRGECMIDSKANDISYDNEKTLADFINYALQTYSNKLSVSPILDSSTLNIAYNAVLLSSNRTLEKQIEILAADFIAVKVKMQY
jgi:hypothetical protein